MTEEIKKILDKLKIKNDRYSHHLKYSTSYENKDEDYEAHLLLNYITNLQKENVDLKKLCDKYEEEHKTTFGTWKTVIVRNEKAVEYIKSKKAIINTDYIRIFDLFEIEEQGYTKDLLNILQGGDE